MYRANHDVQFISLSLKIIMYVCSYTSKPEAPDFEKFTKRLLQIIASSDRVAADKQTRKNLYLASQALYSSTTTTLREIVQSLLGYAFYWSSRQDVSANLYPVHLKYRLLKTPFELSNFGIVMKR